MLSPSSAHHPVLNAPLARGFFRQHGASCRGLLAQSQTSSEACPLKEHLLCAHNPLCSPHTPISQRNWEAPLERALVGRDQLAPGPSWPPSPHCTAWCFLQMPYAVIIISPSGYLPSASNSLGHLPSRGGSDCPFFHPRCGDSLSGLTS